VTGAIHPSLSKGNIKLEAWVEKEKKKLIMDKPEQPLDSLDKEKHKT
jgi:hypothetical protein